MDRGDRNRRLEPKIGVQHALFRVSRGYCYRPGCPHPVLKRGDGGQPVVDVQIAHIYAASDNGPRGRRDLTAEERRSFGNLILLCGVHHQLVDNKENYATFPAALLLAWKTEREGLLEEALSVIPDVTDDSLTQLIEKARSAFKKTLDDGITEIQTTHAELAGMLRDLADLAFDLPRQVVDPNVAEMLHDASLMLRHLPDTSEMLADAASNLLKLPDQLLALDEVLDPTAKFRRLADAFEERVSLAVTVAGQRLIQEIETAENQFVPPPEPIRASVAVDTPASQAGGSRTDITASTTVVRPHWKYFQCGAAIGAAGLLALLFGVHWLVDYLRL